MGFGVVDLEISMDDLLSRFTFYEARERLDLLGISVAFLKFSEGRS